MGKDEIVISNRVHVLSLQIGPSNCSDGNVQLVGGENEREGRVEICYNGVWGTVCADNGWDEVDANVVCLQLGFSDQRALSTNDGRFGDGEGPILLENVKCSEGQSTLSQCVNSMFTGALHRCEHTAGVICMDEFIIPRMVYVTTTNMSRDSTYKSHDTTSTVSDSSVITIVGTVGALFFIVTVIAIIAMVLIAMLRLRKTKANR